MHKSIKLLLFLFMCCLFPWHLHSQNIDTSKVNSIDTIPFYAVDTLGLSVIDSTIIVDLDTLGRAPEKDSAIYFSPRRASILSAIAPGLGQVYNKKYWKVPIIYAGFGVTTYFLLDNLKNIKYYKTQYIADIDTDPLTINNSEISTSQLLKIVNQYKRWRDMTYISYGLIYVLNIIDANVDAHLKEFDISEDISFNIQPYTNFSAQTKIGLVLTIKL